MEYSDQCISRRLAQIEYTQINADSRGLPIAEKFLKDSPNEKSERFMKAMMKMKKLDIAVLEKAYQGDEVTVEIE